MGRLDVRIVEARNLPNNELIGSPDPYVKVEIENSQHKTSVASSTTQPKWDEVFKFVVADPDSAQLELKLWNKNLVSDDFMGQYRMSIAGLTKGVVKDVWCLLQQCKSNAEIHIRLLAHDFGADPAPGQVATGTPVVPAPAPVVIQQQPIIQQQPVYQQQQPVYQQQPMMQPGFQQPMMQPGFQQQPMMQPGFQQPMMMAGQPGYPMQQQQPNPMMMAGQMMGNMMAMQQGMMMGMQQNMMGMNQAPSQTYADFQFVQFSGPVRRATYGPAGTNNDYTMQVNALINRGQRQVHGGIHTVLGDPAPGVPKVFSVWY